MWLTTKDGRHFNTDWINEDEKKSVDADADKKEKQIAQNKKEAEERNKPVLDPIKPTKNAEDAFKHIYYSARKLVKNGENADKIDTIAGGFNYKGDDTPVLSLQALKGIQAKINSTKSDIGLDVELGVITKEQGESELKALMIVQRTLNAKVKERK